METVSLREVRCGGARHKLPSHEQPRGALVIHNLTSAPSEDSGGDVGAAEPGPEAGKLSELLLGGSRRT